MISLVLFSLSIIALAAIQGSGGKALGDDKKPSFYLSVDGSKTTKDKKIQYRVSGRNIKVLQMKIMRIDPREIIALPEDEPVDGAKALEFKSAKLVKEFKLRVPNYKKSGDWVSAEDYFENPGPGFYVITATAGEVKQGNAFFVSDIAMITKRDGGRVIAFVTDRFTGEKKPGAEVTAFRDGKTIFEGKTGGDGTADINIGGIIGSEKIPMVAVWKDNVAVLDMYAWWYNRSSAYRIYTVTDRPVYRPNNKVYFKSTVRKADGNIYSLPDEGEASVEIRDPKGNPVYKQTHKLNKNGALSGDFMLGDEPPIGSYYISVSFGGVSQSSNFTVEEYRKPEYEVLVSSSSDVVIKGDELNFSIEGKYYFGEPVKEAEITYQVTRTPQWTWRYRGKYSWYYDDYNYSYYGGRENVASGKGVLDAKGKFSVKVKTDNADRNYRYSLVASVTDKSRRMVSGSGSALVVNAEYNLELKTGRYMYSPSDKVDIMAVARDHAGKPVQGRAIEFSIKRIEWDSKRNYERTVREILKKEAQTDTEGEAQFAFTPDMTGYFEVSASGNDKRGNAINESASFYVTSSKERQNYWSDGLKIILDKSEYAIGDTARALITSPNPGASALVTVEADSIMKTAVLDMPGGSALFEFEVTENMMPNSYISVALISGSNFYTQTENMIVPPTHKFLNIEIIPDKKEYRPGDQATIVVKVAGSDGKPAGNADVSLGIVDESIYAIQPENATDVREFFYGKRGNSIQTNCSLWFYGRNYGDKASKMAEPMAESGLAMDDMMAPSPAMAKSRSAGGKDGADEYAEAKIRSDFRDTAYWGAMLTTDADGIAQATLTMPDSLTTWRATARAISRETRVGNTTQKTIVRKNLLVRLETPRFFTQNDSQNITAVVHNYLSEPKKVKCQLNAKGLKLKDGGDKFITVPAGGDARVEWHAVVESPQTAWVTVKALTDEESDAMQLDIPVLPFGMQRISAEAGELESGTKTAKISLPDTAVKKASKLRISLSPSIAAAMFESLDYLVGYPYGCVEQTMSRFLPNIVVQQAMQKLNLPQSEKFKELPKMVDQGFQRLKNYQHSDGGWGWWEHDATHPYMTAYVVYGLSQAIKADFKIDKTVYSRGVEALKGLIAKEKDSDTLAYMLFALDAAGEKDEKLLNKLYKNRAALNNYSAALLAIALENNSRHGDAMSIISKLEKSAKRSSTTARWDGKAYAHGWMDNTVESTSYILKAFLRVDPENSIIPLTVRYLVISRKGDHWYSTKDTAAAVFALTDFVVLRENLKPDLRFAVRLNGEKLLERGFKEEDVHQPAVVIEATDLEGKLKPGANKLEVEKLSGSGMIYYTATLEYFDTAEELHAADNGISVKRYYSFDAEGKKRLKSNTELKSGDEIYVNLVVEPGRGYEYVIVEDMLPSGFEVVKEEHDYPNYWGRWRWWYPHKEIRDEKVAFFATSFYEKEYTLNYRIRAEVPGHVAALPARAWLMYFPEVGGNSSSYKFSVVE